MIRADVARLTTIILLGAAWHFLQAFFERINTLRMEESQIAEAESHVNFGEAEVDVR